MLTPWDLARRWKIRPEALGLWRSRGMGPAWVTVAGEVRYLTRDVERWEAGLREAAEVAALN